MACVLRWRPGGRAVIRTETKAHALWDGRSGAGDCRARHRAAQTSCFGSWRKNLARPRIGFLRHRCEQPLRVVLPPTGWVTALAGLLARGSLPGRPAFPVSQWLIRTTGSPLTVAGAATERGCQRQPGPCSLLPPRRKPGNQHTLSIPWAGSPVKMTGDDVHRGVAGMSHPASLTSASRNRTMISKMNAGRFA